MVWFFERGGQYLRCETLNSPDGSGYQLLITHPDGSTTAEQFNDSSELSKRQKALEGGLAAEGWAGPYGRLF